MSSTRLAVIGGGAAGLCAARHFANLQSVVPCVFEQSDDLGGTWVYTDQTGSDSRGEPIHSSMYSNLRTNLPKEVMAFPDFPFEESKAEPPSSFLHHTKVLQYLQQYASAFSLDNFFKMNTKVERVTPLLDDEAQSGKWKITYKCLTTNKCENDIFDAVVVCNGHYSVPIYPNIPDLEKFAGKIIHSHNYRHPEDFSGETVVILGAAASGTDIAVGVSSSAHQVFLAHNKPLYPSKLPVNVIQVRGIERCVGSKGFLLNDGSKVQCDSLILATGYHYTFPFLSDECAISVENNQVKPLYKHLLNIEHPTMALIGLPTSVCPFPLFDRQIQYFKKIILGEVSLPTKEEMYSDTAAETDWRINTLKMREKDFHKMADLQWQYNDDISNLAGIEPLAPVIQKLYSSVWSERSRDLVGYKNTCWVIKNREDYERLTM